MKGVLFTLLSGLNNISSTDVLLTYINFGSAREMMNAVQKIYTSVSRKDLSYSDKIIQFLYEWTSYFTDINRILMLELLSWVENNIQNPEVKNKFKLVIIRVCSFVCQRSALQLAIRNSWPFLRNLNFLHRDCPIDLWIFKHWIMTPSICGIYRLSSLHKHSQATNFVFFKIFNDQNYSIRKNDQTWRKWFPILTQYNFLLPHRTNWLLIKLSISIAHEIVKADKSKQTSLVEKFIVVAEVLLFTKLRKLKDIKECDNLNNFNTVMTVLGGLNNVAVQRLRYIWEVCTSIISIETHTV